MTTWITSDHHFYHANILNFLDSDSNVIRDFPDVAAMHEIMIERWNSKVKPNDKVYHLGDVVMRSTAKYFEILNELNGRKVLIKGNHDSAKLSIYAKYFTDIRAYMHKKTQDNDIVWFSHMPLHPNSIGNGFNVHGHTHQNNLYNMRYINVCVEQTDYYPLTWDEICDNIKRIKFHMEETD